MSASTVVLDRLSDRIRALGDVTRLHIVTLLAGGERCQREIKDELGTSQSLLAFHLKILTETGLVRGRRRGKWVFYSICRDQMLEIEAFLRELRA